MKRSVIRRHPKEKTRDRIGQSGAPGVSSPALVKAAIAATAATSALMASQPRSSARVSANNTPKNG